MEVTENIACRDGSHDHDACLNTQDYGHHVGDCHLVCGALEYRTNGSDCDKNDGNSKTLRGSVNDQAKPSVGVDVCQSMTALHSSWTSWVPDGSN